MLFRYVVFGICLLGIVDCTPVEDVEGKPVELFGLDEVELLEGPFKHATELNRQSLLNYKPDRLLAKFRSEAGLEPRAEHYHGWEDETLAGHSLGHHLSACVLMYQSTGDNRFAERARYIVEELEAVQKADGDGYLGAFPNGKEIFENEIAHGVIRSQPFNLNGIWAPFYTHHKVLAGLRDAYRQLKMEKALVVARNFVDWIDKIISGLNDDQIQDMLDCEHGGMNEVLVDLYVDTGDDRYLELSRKFHHNVILDSLANGKDILPGIHGNTQIPKLIGLARRYEVTGDTNDFKAAVFFWDRVVNHHSYVTGGHGNHEYFGQADKLNFRLSSGTTETCNVYNMLKLTSQLFQWQPNADIADFYERALFNHILSSQHPVDGRVIYNLSLEMGGQKYYQDPEGFTCCVGTGMETHSKYGSNIFYHNDGELYVSQFIAAEANWKDMGVRVRQLTKYPEEQGSTIELDIDDPVEFKVYIRRPYWAETSFDVRVNGEPVTVESEPGSFVGLYRKWETGDKIEAYFPFSLRLETMPDNENRVAILYGPLVLAADLGPEDDPDSKNQDYVPVLLTEIRDPNQWLRPVAGPNTFNIVEVGHPRSFTLKPFYTVHERRYTVYLDMFNDEEWEAYQAAREAEREEKRKLEEMTFDFFQPGDTGSERDHRFEGDSTYIRYFKDRTARSAHRGGWFSFEMGVIKGKPMALVVEYWGGFTGSRTFDILIGDEKIATENIAGKKDGHFIDVHYDIPESVTTNVHSVNVKFEPHSGHRAGPVFGVRTIKR